MSDTTTNPKSDLYGCLVMVLVLAVVAYLIAYGMPKSVKPGQQAERERIAEELRTFLPAAYDERVRAAVFDRPRVTPPQSAELIAAADVLLAKARAYHDELERGVEQSESDRPSESRWRSAEGKQEYLADRKRRAALARARIAKAEALAASAKLARKLDDWVAGLPAVVGDLLSPERDDDPAFEQHMRDAQAALGLSYPPGPIQVQQAREILHTWLKEGASWLP